MAPVKKILCLGNNTIDSDNQCRVWSKNFGVDHCGLLNTICPQDNGCYHVGLSDTFSLDNLFESVCFFDLVIFLNQSKDSYDHIETWQHLKHSFDYLKYFCPVLDDPVDNLNLWLEHPTIYSCKNINVVIKANQFDSLENCKRWTEFTANYMQANNCKWLLYRASSHESKHFEITEYLLQYPNFVLLTPNTFLGNVELNIKNRLYKHWYQMTLSRKAHEQH
jgi:hypothetical protein